MENIGLDVHKRETQICWLHASGTVEQRRIPTTPARLSAEFAARARCRILLEASTESGWVADLLETWGHEVIVADPGFAPMYGAARRVIKTDRRDAQALAHAAQSGVYRRVYRVGPTARAQRATLGVREALVRTRTRHSNLVRALLRQHGLRLPAGTPGRLPTRVAALELPPPVAQAVAPMLAGWPTLNTEIAQLDTTIADTVAAEPVMTRLQSVPGIGPVTAFALVATLADIQRFRTAAQVQAYLGLVPRELSSADRQHRGRITKTGPSRLRWLLVEAAWRIRRSTRPEAAPLQAWAGRIEHRRGRQVAMVALARKLAGICFAVWRDGSVYTATP